MAIKPSGVPYDELTWTAIVVLDLESGAVVDGRRSGRPPTRRRTSCSTARSAEVGGIVHTHSPYATAWAQAGRELPCFGTTHADHFDGPVPVTRRADPAEIAGAYEANTGEVIVETFAQLELEPLGCPAALVVDTAVRVGCRRRERRRERSRARGRRGAARSGPRCSGPAPSRSTPTCSSPLSAQARRRRVLRPGQDEGAPAARRGRPSPARGARCRRRARARLSST